MSSAISRLHQLSAIFLLPALLFSAVAGAWSQAADGPLAQLEKIAKVYKIEVVTAELGLPVKTRHGTIGGKHANRKELQDYVGLCVPEFSLYPTDLVRLAQLKRVALCSELSFAGQRRNAIPDYEQGTLYLDVSRGTHSKPYLRKVVHHEFFHMIDYRDDGSVYQDERWAALNPPGFKYGSGGRAAQVVAKTSVLTTEFPGFLNHYSTTAVEEDKAEIFANLLVDLPHVEGRAKKDLVLKAKMERMQELLAKFCPEMNDTFWKNIRSPKRADK